MRVLSLVAATIGVWVYFVLPHYVWLKPSKAKRTYLVFQGVVILVRLVLRVT